MTPGVLTIPIYKGAKWSFTFRFVVTETDTPLDLTGLGPFVCEVRHPTKERLLATATVTSAYDATGEITITLTALQTDELPLGDVRMGVRDALNTPYLEGLIPVKWFTPTPA